MNQQIEKLLLRVQKPGRYVGGELNAVMKDRDSVDVRFAFCFPDTYEVGMSHLGMKILYSQFNEKDYIWCERVFAPWVDMEEEMRTHQIPLFALESSDPLGDFDFIGFTLQYELSYTNVLNMLDLAGLPLRTADRTDDMPIICAGGPCAVNPEPIADFIDLFFIGEGEEVDLEIIDLYREMRKSGEYTRAKFLRAAAQVPGVYVPSLYDVTYNEDGTVCAVTPKDGAPETVRKRIITDMNTVYYPETFIVPSIEIVHDRAVSEVQRGCYRACRFCQAGFIYRPVRTKSIEKIDQEAHCICEHTGYEELSLVSLSTSDYPDINGLLDRLLTWTNDERVSISLPSQRVDSFSTELMDKLKSVRRSGLTFAPEAGTQRMRDVINKNVTEEVLLRTVRTAFAGGWLNIKLYFMIGLPTETLDDVAGIAQLGQAVVNEFYQNPDRPKGRSVNVTVSASSFVPKAFTPFQWEPQDTIETLHEKQQHLKASVTTRKITCNYHEATTSFLEGVFARGDRRLATVLEEAQKQGCKMDGWSECFDYDRWMSIFEQCGVDPTFYNQRRRSFDEVLPWDHIDMGIKKSFLIAECKKAYENATSPDCKQKCSACGAACFKGGICYER